MATALILDIDRLTGDYIQGWPRCQQSIETILMTRLNTRVMRLWWGSKYLDMMDKPQVQQSFTDGIVAACDAINRYEPEFRVQSVLMTPSAGGTCTCTVTGVYIPDTTTQSVIVSITSPLS